MKKNINIDKDNIWHPFTQEATAKDDIKIVRGEGLYLWDEEGRRYADLVSSWWTSCHGHSNVRIAKAIYKQALDLEHVIFANFTHDPAIDLVTELKKYLHKDLSRFFFSDNGSTAVEIALKMCYQYWQNIGDNARNKFMTMEGNYHGDTVGVMSVGKSSGMYSPFEKLLFPVEVIPFPEIWFDDDKIEEKEKISLDFIETYLKKNHSEVVAFFLESIIQGAGGMRILRAEFIDKICKLFKDYNIPVIFDEVMTGFGRTGTMFSYQQTNVVPDIICLSKALTGGALPMALTVASEEIYKSFYSEDDFGKTFLHGHSYTANPLACAAGLESLKIFEENKALEKIKRIEEIHKEELEKLKQYDFLEKFRTCGLISAFDIKNKDGYGSNFSNDLKYKFYENGLLLRPLGNTIYLLPPYIISEDELRKSYAKIIEIIVKMYNK